ACDYFHCRPSPNYPLVYCIFRKHEDGIIIFNRSYVVSQRAAAWLLFTFVVAGKITADLGPTLSVIARFENALRCRVEHVRIVRRKHERRNPLKAMDEIRSSVPCVIQRPDTYVLHFLFIFIVASNVTFVV